VTFRVKAAALRLWPARRGWRRPTRPFLIRTTGPPASVVTEPISSAASVDNFRW